MQRTRARHATHTGAATYSPAMTNITVVRRSAVNMGMFTLPSAESEMTT